MTSKQQSKVEPLTLIIDARPQDGVVGLFEHPVKRGGVVYFWTDLPNTTVLFNEGSPLVGPNPVAVPIGKRLSVQVKEDATLRTFPCEFQADGLGIPRKMQVQVSNTAQDTNGFSVTGEGITLMVQGALNDDGLVDVRFLNVTRRTRAVTVNNAEEVEVTPGQVDEAFRLENGLVSVELGRHAVGNGIQPFETGGTQQADIYIEPPP